MQTYTDGKKDKKVPDGILAKQNAPGEYEVPEWQIPTAENNVPVSVPVEHTKNGEPADGYQGRAEDSTRDDLLQSAEEFPGAPAPDEAQREEPSKSPGGALLHGALAADENMLFATNAVIDIDVPIDLIEPITAIPDYVTPTSASLPIVLRTPDGFHLQDGPEKIIAARESGLRVVRCRGHYMAVCNAEDLAFAKAGSRWITEGGHASSGELVNVTAILREITIANHPHMFVNLHGGARIPGQSNADDEDNLVKALADRLGKKPKTIMWYLKEAEYQRPQTLTQLAQGRAPKSFFDGIRNSKGDMLLKIQGRSVPPEQWTPLISEFTENLFSAFQANSGKFEPKTVGNVFALFTKLHFPDESAATPASTSEETDERSLEGQGVTSDKPTAGTCETGDTGEDEREETHGPDESSKVTESKDDSQAPEGSPDQPSTSTDDKGHSKGLEKSGRKPRQALKAPSRFDKKKDELVQLLSDFTSEAIGITDEAGLQALALKVLAHGYRLCSQLLSDEDLEKAVKKLRADERG